jgi:hypothetical protein
VGSVHGLVLVVAVRIEMGGPGVGFLGGGGASMNASSKQGALASDLG